MKRANMKRYLDFKSFQDLLDELAIEISTINYSKLKHKEEELMDQIIICRII